MPTAMKDTTTAARGIFAGRVLRRRTLCDEHFELTIAFDRFPDAAPGQFVQVLCRDSHLIGDSESSPTQGGASSAMLRRPFSIGGLRRDSTTVEIDLLGRVVGPGTRGWTGEGPLTLSVYSARSGDRLWCHPIRTTPFSLRAASACRRSAGRRKSLGKAAFRATQSSARERGDLSH